MIFFKKTEEALSSVSSSAQSQQLSDLSKKIAQTELPEHARLCRQQMSWKSLRKPIRLLPNMPSGCII